MPIRSDVFKIVFFVFCSVKLAAQADDLAQANRFYKSTFFYDTRGTNVIEAVAGTAVVIDNSGSTVFDLSLQAGYKRYIWPHFNLGLSFNRFDLTYEEVEKQGYMSFDLNFEYSILPYSKVSPFLFVGSGYHADDHFDQTAIKFQGGCGIEFVIAERLGVKLMADYNHVLSDEVDGQKKRDVEDNYLRVLAGINIYFGGQKGKKKALLNIPTVFKSNQIIKEN